MKKIKMIMCVRCGNKVHPAMELCPFCDHRLHYPEKPDGKQEKINYLQTIKHAIDIEKSIMHATGISPIERLHFQSISNPKRHAKIKFNWECDE